MKISRQAFEKMIWEAVSEIPKPFRRRLENVAILLESHPTPSQRRQFDLRPEDTLLGLYQGVPNTQRGIDYGNVLPDQIIIFQEPLTRMCRDRAALQREIRKTVWHEVGHYFGLSDRELRRLEKESAVRYGEEA